MSVVSESAPAENQGPAFEVLDAAGKRIVTGSIVGMADPHGSWSRYQGLVVYPDSDLEGEGYTVPVFFNREVSGNEFRYYDPHHRCVPVEKWDREHIGRAAKGDITFLFDEEVWKVCPRIRFFKPEELLVQERWNIAHLCDRVFPGRWHHYYEVPFGEKFSPSHYMCWREGCSKPAEPEVALGNCWGTVSPLCLCKEHHKEVHGLCGDSFPAMKKHIFLRDGRQLGREGEELPRLAA